MQKSKLNSTASSAQNMRNLESISCISPDNNAHLEAKFNEMKAMFYKCDFESRKSPEEEKYGRMVIPFNVTHLPKTPSLPSSVVNLNASTEIDFNIHIHKMHTQYIGTFSIKHAVIKAKFVGDTDSHYFSVGEHEMLCAAIYMGHTSDKEIPQAFLVDRRLPETVVGELEEFAMLAVTDGHYYRNYKEPRALDEDLVLFTCFNKTHNLSHDTVASFSRGLCDSKALFTDDDIAEDSAD